jgi:polysaccharide biosynthesis transport protein
MEVAKLIRLFKSWFWLLIVGVVLGVGVSLLSSINVSPTYKAETRVLIGGFIASPNPNPGDIETGAGLAETYVQLATTTPVLQAVIDELGLPMTALDLQKLVLAGKPGDPPIILIQVFYNDPEMAVVIANKVTEQLILRTPSNLTPAQEAQIDLANEQIEILNQQIQTTLTEIETIDERLAGSGAAAEVNPLTQQRSALVEQVNQASANMAQFSSTIASLEQQTNTLQVIDPATTAPFFRTGPGRLESAFLSGLVGLVLAALAILSIGYFDPTIRTSKDTTTLLDRTVLGTIPYFGKKNGGGYTDLLVSGFPPRSSIPEAYRALQTNLLFAAETNSNGVYIVTSPGADEGKTITSINLAITMANSGLEVLLIDADLIKPKIHDILNLDNSCGLTTLLSVNEGVLEGIGEGERARYSAELSTDPLATLRSCVQTTNIPRLRAITGGPYVENSTQLLSSSDLKSWIHVMQAQLGVDVILFDSAPCLTVADTSILAAKIKSECDCILVVRAGQTKRESALRAQQQFNHIGINIQGIILNRVKSSDIDHGYTSGYVNINTNNVYSNGQFIHSANQNNHVQVD